MTDNEAHQMVREEMDRTDKRGMPCHVHHPDAGGPCKRPATTEVYGLHFCEAHGEDVRLGAASQGAHQAWKFFERFRHPHVEGVGSAIEREIDAALDRIVRGRPSGEEETRAMLRAYPNATEQVREHVLSDNEDEPGLPTFYDSLMDGIYTLHECMEISYQDGQTWLVEILERERESASAHAACAYRMRQQERAGDRPAPEDGEAG